MMKENNVVRLFVCPRCGQSYFELPALSRVDNETLICPDCGTREALDSLGVKPEEQEQILAAIHRCIYLSQQMRLRHQLVYDYELYQISIHFPAFQHLASPLSILPYLSEKAQLQPDFFDRLNQGNGYSVPLIFCNYYVPLFSRPAK